MLMEPIHNVASFEFLTVGRSFAPVLNETCSQRRLSHTLLFVHDEPVERHVFREILKSRSGSPRGPFIAVSRHIAGTWTSPHQSHGQLLALETNNSHTVASNKAVVQTGGSETSSFCVDTCPCVFGALERGSRTRITVCISCCITVGLWRE
jgi:hypothetical protein